MLSSILTLLALLSLAAASPLQTVIETWTMSYQGFIVDTAKGVAGQYPRTITVAGESITRVMVFPTGPRDKDDWPIVIVQPTPTASSTASGELSTASGEPSTPAVFKILKCFVDIPCIIKSRYNTKIIAANEPPAQNWKE